ncbi:MAG: hypothetical protein AVDCRST_MAG30-1076 [uncultured Solirubrobacteraceae bacterium]|uniref:Uncharacterized protein n=1 Tax=uncultured Solirubrobacteraceae bacterium TaxID=1162706 RepID=A0A6J4S882_9ACTN|nr:MAG: hypothetical protein AVDCRST_MAG30-1076 [uncultured Solirubrobacteraceae bacterium]
MEDDDRPPAPLNPPDAPRPDPPRTEGDEPPKVSLEDVSRLSPEHAPDDA